jgi:hypothetical protein
MPTRLDRAARVLSQMQAGGRLHLTYQGGGRSCWALTSGEAVSDDIAQLVIRSASVAAAGDVLFQGVRSQTYEWWSSPAVGAGG